MPILISSYNTVSTRDSKDSSLPPGTTLVLGVDGGGTKTLGLISDQDQHILARQLVGATNPNVVGVEGSAKNIYQLISACCEEAHCTPADLRSVVLGLAGAGGTAIHKSLRDAVNALVTKGGAAPLSITVEGDTRIALEGAFAGGPGIVIISGTGSMLIGKTPQGTIHTVGGWGRVLGDEGSGYYLGSEALKAVTRDYDGRGDSGTLRRVLAQKYGWDTRDRLIAAVYREKFDIPSLAPLVLQAADNGDSISMQILQRGAAHLAEQVKALTMKMGITGATGLVMCGGLVDHETVYAKILAREIPKLCPQVEIRSAILPPAHGAVLLALEQLAKPHLS